MRDGQEHGRESKVKNGPVKMERGDLLLKHVSMQVRELMM